MFRAVIVGPFQDELAEGFGETRLDALTDAKEHLSELDYALYHDDSQAYSVEYHEDKGVWI